MSDHIFNFLSDLFQASDINNAISHTDPQDIFALMESHGIDLSNYSSEEITNAIRYAITDSPDEVINTGTTLHSENQISFGSAYPKEHYLHEAEYYQKQLDNAEYWAEEYTKDGNFSKAASYASSAKDYASKVESCLRYAKDAKS